MKLPQYLTTVTPFSRLLAMVLFILFPFVGFYLGTRYQSIVDKSNQQVKVPTVAPSTTTPSRSLEDSAVNWKKYTNNKYNYSIELPKDWNTNDIPDMRLQGSQGQAGDEFTGPEGDIQIYWGEIVKSSTQTCEDKQIFIQIKNKSLPFCLTNSQNNYPQLQAITNNSVNEFRIAVFTRPNNQSNKNRVDEILSTLNFNN